MNKTDTHNNMAKLENTLRERSQGQKVTYMIPFTGNSQNRQIPRDRRQISRCHDAWEN